MAEDIRQLNRSLAEKVIDRAGSDPQFKQQFLDDPEGAIRGAGFPEVQRLEEMQEVQGQAQCKDFMWTFGCSIP